MPRAGTVNLRSNYSFTTAWKFSAPIDRVWDAIWSVERWPEWWNGLTSVKLIQPGTGPDQLGAVRRFSWNTPLGYRLVFDLKLVRVEKLHRLESHAIGDLEGSGVWNFTTEGNQTVVRYDWNVATNKWWMNWLAPIARPLFSWNHDRVMSSGESGLRRLLE